LSHAEINHACRDSIKTAILSDKNMVTPTLLLQTIHERQETKVEKS